MKLVNIRVSYFHTVTSLHLNIVALSNYHVRVHHLVRIGGGEGGQESTGCRVLADSNVDVWSTKHWRVVVHVREANLHPSSVRVTGVPPAATPLKSTSQDLSSEQCKSIVYLKNTKVELNPEIS